MQIDRRTDIHTCTDKQWDAGMDGYRKAARVQVIRQMDRNVQ